MNQTRTTIFFVLLTLVFAGIPAFAQTDFSGEWNPLFHEDDPDRGPGPDLSVQVALLDAPK